MIDVPLDPQRCGLIVFDLLEAYRPGAEAAGVLGPVRRLVDGCRERGVTVFWARADHRADGSDLARTQTDQDNQHRPWGPDNPRPTVPAHGSGSAAYRTLVELGQREDDVDVPKHRFSAFHGTHLQVQLGVRGIDTLFVVGGSTHVGVASTVYDARDRDYQVVVVSDGLTGRQPQRDFFAEQVFPRLCQVGTVDQVLTALS